MVVGLGNRLTTLHPELASVGIVEDGEEDELVEDDEEESESGGEAVEE